MSDGKLIWQDERADAIITGSLSTVEKPWCAHRAVQVDEEKREVTCRSCGRVLDAFNVLLEYATNERNLVSRRKMLGEKLQRLHDEVERLKRDEKNIRARLARLSAKEGSR